MSGRAPGSRGRAGGSPRHVGDQGGAADHLQFEWDGDAYAVPLSGVREVAYLRAAEASLSRGGVPIPSASFGAVTDRGSMPKRRSNPVILLGRDGLSGGLVVDRVAGVTSIPESSLLPLPDRFEAPSRGLVRGLALREGAVTVVLEPGAIVDAILGDHDTAHPTG